MYAGGWFVQVQGAAARHIAKFDGERWTEVGGGVDGNVLALAVQDGDDRALFVGGRFTQAGTVQANNIAKWDGVSWNPLSEGVNGSVHCMTMLSEDSTGAPTLIVGGKFISAGGVVAHNIATWDGSIWSPLGDGMNGPVLGLTVFDDGSPAGAALYACGEFNTTGGAEVSGIARWDGSTWSPVGTGIGGRFVALTVFDDGMSDGPALYAGGAFNLVDGGRASGLARWDGMTWTVTTAMHGGVLALMICQGTPEARDNGFLYAGGVFTIDGGGPANRIAKWDGKSWTSLGDGVNKNVQALGILDSQSGRERNLFVGGTFTVSPAGDSFLAQWQECIPLRVVPGDVNGDSLVNGIDLLAVSNAWGPCPAPCPADLNGNGVVDIDDLLEIIHHWS
jgi:hypothetical protein